jgi:DNA-binding XRE family transcriptional regulator
MSAVSDRYVNPEWEFSDRVRKVRRNIARMTQEQMADLLGVEQKAYAAWETGRTKPSDIVAVSKQIERLWPGKVTASWMLGVDESPPPPPSGGEWSTPPLHRRAPREARTPDLRIIRPEIAA